tara:strand:- start:802 stop:2340 length:1539 start_codon:yes stop_codon:yes gene_type:complete
MVTKIILGPPGTGKTEYLLKRIEEELANGTDPTRIGYFAYTVKAANEARTRAMNRFKELDKKDFIYFRTLHSLAFRQLSLTKNDVMKDEHFKELSELLGIKLSNTNRKMDTYGFPMQDDIFAKIIDMARVRNITLEQQFQEIGHLDGGWMKLKYIHDGIKKYKKERKVYDFTDMIMEFNNRNDDDIIPSFDVLIIDEAQDLLPVQWKMVKKIMEKATRIYIAGDDDQSIFKWAGANPQDLIGLEGERYILNQSHRIPKKIHDAATNLINRVENRIPKIWQPKKEEGDLQFHNMRQAVYSKMDQGQWLIMARDNYNLEQIATELRGRGFYYSRYGIPSVPLKKIIAINAWTDLTLRNQPISLNRVNSIYHYMTVNKGVAYGFKTMPNADPDASYSYDILVEKYGLLIPKYKVWHQALDRIPIIDTVYIIAILRRKQNLNLEPRINLSTIHGAKGGEADNVMLLTDLPRKADESYFNDPDDERRVFYVGMTRAKKALHIVRSETDREFKEIFVH